MSSETIDLLWDESIKELQQLVDIERNIDESKCVTIKDAHHHFAKLYIRYAVVLQKLNKCYELTVQPQKRLDIKLTLENVIYRVINLRHLLVKWAPPNPDVVSTDETQEPFSWEYTDINHTLRELNTVPSNLSTTIPSFYKEDALQICRDRNSLVLKLLKQKYGDELPSLEEKKWSVKSSCDTKDDINVRACSRDENDTSDKENKVVDCNQKCVNNQVLAATKIQKNLRRHIGKKKANRVRQWLDLFVGMKSNDDINDNNLLVKYLDDVCLRRKQEQSYCEEKYKHDLARLKDIVKEEEGFRMEVELREERIKWIADQVVYQNAIPDSFDGFYIEDEISSENKSMDTKDTKSKGKVKEYDRDKKRSNDEAVAVDVELPSISAPPIILDSITRNINIYESRWQQRSVGPDRVRSQYHDEDLAKELIIRNQVKTELINGVEEKLLSNLLKIKAVEDADKKKSKSKKVTKKGKKGKDKKVGGKGKKEKSLPGNNLPGMKDMSIEQMLQELINHGLICIPAQNIVEDLIGGYDSQPPKVTSKDNKVSIFCCILNQTWKCMLTVCYVLHSY